MLESLNEFTRSGLNVAMQDTPQDTPHDTQHDTPHDNLGVTSLIRNLLTKLNGEMSRSEIQQSLGLHDRFHFSESYLKPALVADLIEMTIPDKPKSRNQKYRLTEKGKALAKREA